MSRNNLLTSKDVRAELRDMLKEAGSRAALARKLGITATHVGDLLNGNRDPGDKVLPLLGLKKVIFYTDSRRGGSR